MLHLQTTQVLASHLDDQTVQSLANQLQGELIRAGDANYDEARAVWNGMIDRHPALIARCATVEDVVAAVNFARKHHLPLAVRGGGHNVAGLAVAADDGLVVDLSVLNQVEVDPQARTARAQGGATIGDLDAATQAHGLAAPMGVVSATGIAGLTLGGGFGWLRNKYGLSCDNLIGAQVVTADGRVVTANENENRDLLWGLRGGGGNFGIVTEFEYQLYPVGPEVAFTFILHDAEGDNLKRAIQFYRDYSSQAPDEISTIMASGIVPPEPELFPEPIHHKPFVLLGAMYAGEAAEGQQVMKPLIDFGEPLVDFSGIMPYVEAQKAFDADYPDGLRYYWKSLNLSRLDDEVIDRFVEHARRQPSVFSTVDLWYVGGAVKRGSASDSAFHGRQAAFLLSPEANWEHPEDDEANIAWLREFIADMEEFSDGSRYLNFPGFLEEGDEMMRAAFGDKYQRLQALKDKYDPTNFFSLNQNIKPSH
ncbi:MAG: FAD-binding oxidoreductase [Anaerolineaceae bacterium]|nr:FAD-binding oxidoreductase [Anaerolineaceae bacterium]MCB9102584.1 FAD-binding oxidoreductase [Anaerolineales bacterium]